jgi:hypothetical protein
MADDSIQDLLPGIDRVVSRSGTRHIIGPQDSKFHGGRISTLCGMGLRPGEGPFEPLRDCIFCQEEWFDSRRSADA